MNRPAPLLSIVVPTFGSQAVLGAALQSIAAQSWRDFEVIISDGASSDATLAMAAGFAQSLPALVLDSRPDSGVYDAINRGIALARGEWVLIVGSDDRLHGADTLAKLAPHLQAATADVVYGDVRMMAANTNGVPAGARYAGAVPLERLVMQNICQQAICYRRALFDDIGAFDLRYRLHADWALNLRAAVRGSLQWVDIVVTDYAATGMSAAQGDARWAEDMPEWLRATLLANAGDRRLWPLQRCLLRQADRFRRRGRWREAFAHMASYLTLRARRVFGGTATR